MEAMKLPSRKFKQEMLALIPLLLPTTLEKLIALLRSDAKVTNAPFMIQLKRNTNIFYKHGVQIILKIVFIFL